MFATKVLFDPLMLISPRFSQSPFAHVLVMQEHLYLSTLALIRAFAGFKEWNVNVSFHSSHSTSYSHFFKFPVKLVTYILVANRLAKINRVSFHLMELFKLCLIYSMSSSLVHNSCGPIAYNFTYICFFVILIRCQCHNFFVFS